MTKEDQGDFINIDGRLVRKDLYPPDFNWNLIKGLNHGDGGPVVDYNDLVMEVHIVDARKYVSKRRKIDPMSLYGPPETDTTDVTSIRFPNQNYHISR